MTAVAALGMAHAVAVAVAVLVADEEVDPAVAAETGLELALAALYVGLDPSRFGLALAGPAADAL